MKNILAVDDSSSVRKLVEFSLKSKGYQVTSAEDGQEAMDLLVRGQYELIVLDINMPRMDGLEFLKRIRTDGLYAELPVIMLTTEGQDEDRERALSLGANGYIVKPFKPTELLRAVAQILTR